MLERINRQAGLMTAMMRHLGIDLLDFVEFCLQELGQSFERVASRCLTCGQSETCQAWLTSAGQNDPEGYRRFCPNSERLLDYLRTAHAPRRRSSGSTAAAGIACGKGPDAPAAWKFSTPSAVSPTDRRPAVAR